jgi:hypothetical protein
MAWPHLLDIGARWASATVQQAQARVNYLVLS